MPSRTFARVGSLVVALLVAALAAPRAGWSGPDAQRPDLRPKTDESGGTVDLFLVDATTGEPVPWASVVLGPGRGFLADALGSCRLRDVAAGVHSVTVVHVSYESARVDVEVPKRGNASLRVALTPRPVAIPPVHVEGSAASSLEGAVRGERRVLASDGAALPNPGGDLFRLLTLTPGVLSEDVGGEFHLRGGGVDETLVRIDGMEVRSLFHGREFGGVTGVIPLAIVERLDVHAGAFPAELGGRNSGAVDVALRTVGAPGTHGNITIDVTSARALLEHNGRRGALFVSATEGYLDRLLSAVQRDVVAEPAYRDLLLRGVRSLGNGTKVSGSYLRVEDHVTYEDGIASHAIDADYVDHSLWGRARWFPRPDLAVQSTAWGALSTRSRHFSEDFLDDRTSRRIGARAEATLYRGEHTWSSGADLEGEWVHYEQEADLIVRIDREGRAHETTEPRRGSLPMTRMSLWAEDEWAPLPALTIGTGLRADHDSYSEEFHVGPRVSSALQLPSHWLVRAAWGRHVQPPRGELVGDGDLFLLTDRTQRADHTVVGVEKRISSVRLGAEAWEKRFLPFDGVVTRTIDDETERHVITRGLSRGLDVFARREGARSRWWASYSLGRSEWNNGPDKFVRDFDALHTLALANTWDLGSRWELGVSYRFRTGTPYTEQTWRRSAGTDWALNEGAINGARLPDYHRVDVRLGRRFRFQSWELSVWGEALNLTNHDNVLWYAWRFRDEDGTANESAERVTRTGVPGVPSVGVEARF